MTDRLWQIVTFGAVAAMLLALLACKPPAPPAPPEEPAKAMIVVVPGLGEPNAESLCNALAAAFPKATVVNFGTGRNSYLSDVKGYLSKNPHGTLITIGFSYGTDKIDQQIGGFGPVALDVKLDPVPEELGGRYTITPNVKRTLVVTGDWSGLFRAGIDGPYDEMKVHTPHTKFIAHPAVIAIVLRATKEALQ